MSAVIDRQPQKLSEFDSTVPRDLEALVSKALNKDKDERYQTAEQLLADLKPLQKNAEVSASKNRRHLNKEQLSNLILIRRKRHIDRPITGNNRRSSFR
jgi:serine/threonine protein kinase